MLTKYIKAIGFDYSISFYRLFSASINRFNQLFASTTKKLWIHVQKMKQDALFTNDTYKMMNNMKYYEIKKCVTIFQI